MRRFDDAPGVIGVTREELPVLPDAALTDRAAGHIDIRKWFPNPGAPLEIEIGCGKGGFLVEQAPRSPATNFLGIEYEREFYAYAADRLRRRNLTNVRMLCTNAVELLHWRVPDSIVSVIHLYYSDPWPKTKHHKNRVVQHAFLKDVGRVLVPGGELRVVTDHDELWAWDLELFRSLTEPGPGAEPPPFEMLPFRPVEWVSEGGAVGTNYERKKTGEGKPPHACVLRKKGG